MRERMALLARRHAGFLAVCGLLFGGFEFLITMAVARLELGDTLTSLVTILPPTMRLVLESTFSGDFTARGLQAFGWTHPISHAVGAVVAVMLATRAIAGACEDGTIETLLALPLTRRRYLAAETTFALLALAAAAFAGALGSALGQRAFRLDGVDAATLGRLAFNWWALQAAWFGVALALSAWAREGARASGTTFVLAVASFVAAVIGRLWEGAHWVLTWTLYDYFMPRDILLRGASIVRPSLVLLAVMTAGLAVAFTRFERRDLP